MAPVPVRRQDYGNASSATHVQALRQFLLRQGYNIPDHGGSVGPILASALKNWSSGVDKRNPQHWNQVNHRHLMMDMKPGVHGVTKPIGPNDTKVQNKAEAAAVAHTKLSLDGKPVPKHDGVPPNSPQGHPHGGNPGGGGGGGGGGSDPLSGITGMLTSMLGGAATAKQIPLSLADQAAAPDTALAATLGDQIGRLPSAKARALQNLSDWFGQVQGAEKKGAAKDQALADAGSSAMQDAAKGIMASLGGSAMAGSGQVGAVGANDANTLTAMGANDASLANELAPIFKLSEADAKNTRSQQYDNQLSDLKDQQGQATGQADAARAAAVMQILGANNSARQTNFGNETGLLNSLAGLQISGMNAVGAAQSRQLSNALKVSELQRNSQKSANGLDAMTPSERSSFADKITQGIVSGKLSWPDALRAARNSARTAGLNPRGNQVIQAIIGPALANAGITGPNGGFWPAIYQR